MSPLEEGDLIMPDASTERDDRPAEVSDPLLWRLAAAVADTHQPDENGSCDSPSCLGAGWPCAAWNSAQDGLRVARGGPRTVGAEPIAEQDQDAPAGRSTPLPRSADRRTSPRSDDRAPVAVTPAA